MISPDVFAAVVGERKGTKAEGKHYVPFSKEEWETLKTGFKRPELRPNDLKLIILGMASGLITVGAAKPPATPAK